MLGIRHLSGGEDTYFFREIEIVSRIQALAELDSCR